jgi:hypothetical protein
MLFLVRVFAWSPRFVRVDSTGSDALPYALTDQETVVAEMTQDTKT